MVNISKTQQQEKELIFAAKIGWLENIKSLIADGVNVNAVNEYGISALNNATIGNCTGTAKFLIESGADVNTEDSNGRTPLINAMRIKNNNLMISILIESGANVNAVGASGCSTLYTAVAYKNIKIVKMLVASGADINAVNMFGHTALHQATTNRNLGIIRLLIKSGADLYKKDIYGTTPLENLGKVDVNKYFKYKDELIAMAEYVRKKRLNKEDCHKNTSTNYEYDI